MKVLIIEDEADIRKLLRVYLEREGFVVDEATNGQRGLRIFSEKDFDLVILDIMIPELNGWAVCEKIRKISKTPIIMVTAKSSDSDKILGLELGADDYLVKPFSPKELIARIKSLFRRIRAHQPDSPNSSQSIFSGSLGVHPGQHTVSYGDIDIPLTPKEFTIIHCLIKNKDKVYTRNELLLEVWGDQFTDARTVDAHIKTIREKFRKKNITNTIISTVWGVGYRIGGQGDADNI